MRYFVESEASDGRQFIADYKGIADKQQIIDEFDNGLAVTSDGKPLRLIRIVSSRNRHICKYCYGIAENGSNEDLLCDECRSIFGHTYFSEL